MAPFKVCRLQAGGLQKAAVLHRQGKAHMLLHGEHSQAAQELLMQAVKLDCCLADAWTCLGHCFCQNDNLDMAQHCYRRAVHQQVDKRCVRQLSALARHLSGSKDDKAAAVQHSVALAKQAVALDTGDGCSWYLLGTAFLSDHFAAFQPQGGWGSSRLQQALKAYQRALACGADLADLHWNCAMVQLYLQDYQAALQGFFSAGQRDSCLPWQQQVESITALLGRLHKLVRTNGGLEPSRLQQVLRGLHAGLGRVAPQGSVPVCCSALQPGRNVGLRCGCRAVAHVAVLGGCPGQEVAVDAEGSCFVLIVRDVKPGSLQRHSHLVLLSPEMQNVKNFLSKISGRPGPSKEKSKEMDIAGWSPDRGSGQNAATREKLNMPALVETGHHAGNSRVQYLQRHYLFLHAWKRDFFHTAIHTKLAWVLVVISIIYTASFFFFSALWYLIIRFEGECIQNNNNETGFVTALIFSIVTEQTIGYGNTFPNECWSVSWLMQVQSIFGMLLDAITIGIVFARISLPKQRGRTIAISDKATIARRDGILKFMFRVADIRRTQVISPTTKAFLYTWGEGRTTAEGEYIPARIEELDIGYIDGMLLLPLIQEHTIDERSPLCGHTHDSLMAVHAEIVVTFEGTTEFGNPFMARQSYLAAEVMWGHKFAPIIFHPEPNGNRYRIDFSEFHNTNALPGFEDLTNSKAAEQVVHSSLRTVPYPLLRENTFVLSDSLTLSPMPSGNLGLSFRVGDTYPNQHLEIHVRLYVYRWDSVNELGVPQDYAVDALEVGYEDGSDRLLLWLPMTVTHVINESSPLRNWKDPQSILNDQDATIVAIVEGYMYSNSQNRMRMRLYHTRQDVFPNYVFTPIVSPPAASPDFKPRVDWEHFHSVEPLPSAIHARGHLPPDLQRVTSHWGLARDDAAEQAARARVYARSKSAQPFLGKKSLAAGSTPATDVLQPSPHAALRSFSAPHEADTNPLDLTRRSIRSTAPEAQQFSTFLPHDDPESLFRRRSSRLHVGFADQQNGHFKRYVNLSKDGAIAASGNHPGHFPQQLMMAPWRLKTKR
eukprot:jgi/Astpho2/4119/fgenesh1_pg.00063_%23_104_t